MLPNHNFGFLILYLLLYLLWNVKWTIDLTLIDPRAVASTWIERAFSLCGWLVLLEIERQEVVYLLFRLQWKLTLIDCEILAIVILVIIQLVINLIVKSCLWRNTVLIATYKLLISIIIDSLIGLSTHSLASEHFTLSN